ncbi:MAG: hypothetical protein IKQ91_10905 [Oscillospiraceae bacterium]|nr:hypothetical protein [Oscillospiraceae bacterium]
MGLFDVFSKGGKYFGKAIEPKCEYCEHGKRSSDGNKVLCTKKGMVDASFHCPKFQYSPLKRIPVKQLERVGWLEGDYDEKEFAETPKAANAAKPAAPAAAPAPAATAPAPAAVPAPAPAPAAAPAPAPAPAAPVGGGDLAALAAMAEAAGDYQPEEAKTPDEAQNTDGDNNNGMNALSSM